MNIYLLRHAKAEEVDPRSTRADADRVLTPVGIRKMREIANGMRVLDLQLDLILSSPYARARQTAEIAAQALDQTDLVKLTPRLAAVAKPTDIINEICDRYADRQNILLVGHEPYLGQLASLLLTGRDILAVNFKKAGLMGLSVAELKSGHCAVLEWFLTPRQLVAMA